MKATKIFCKGCGVEFLSKGKQRYCSRPCQNKHYAAKRLAASRVEIECRHCRTVFLPSHARQAHCSDACRMERHKSDMRAATRLSANMAYPKDCAKCGSRFITTNKNKTNCSKACARLRRDGTAYKYKRNQIHAKQCIGCGAPFKARETRQRYCTKRCGHDSRSARRAIVRQEIRQLKRIANRSNSFSKKHDALLNRLTRPDTECTECGSVIPGRSNRTSFCSDFCLKRNEKRRGRIRRRAAMKAAKVETVDPMLVFDRDGWTCQACGIPTPRECRGTYDDNAPELDHVYPLSKGGDHSYDNTQLLCRKCNAEKSDQVSFLAVVKG